MGILALGTAEVIAALGLAGMEGRTIDDRDALREALADTGRNGAVRILVIEEQIADLDRETVDRLKLAADGPLVVEIPGVAGPAEHRISALETVRRALGIDL